MPFELVERPVPGQAAFKERSHAAILSQAAILLLIGAQMRRKEVGALGVEELGVPRIAPFFEGGVGTVDPVGVRLFLARELGQKRFPTHLPAVRTTVEQDIVAEIFDILAQSPNQQWTLGILEACLRHPEEIVRVAAAATYHGFTSENERLIQILEEGTRSYEELVRALAATALAHAAPDHVRVSTLQLRTRRPAGAAGGAHTTLLVHGTLARQETWWQPDGDFHTYLGGLLPAVGRTPPWDPPYSKDDYFDWTGGYTDVARDDGANLLVQWASSHGAQRPDLIAHSHGGNVAMLATQKGLEAGELVLLSCPALPNVLPDFGRVGRKVVSIRVRMDLVLVLDSMFTGSVQEFNDPRVAEHKLQLWFDHTATHRPDVWQNVKYAMPAML